MELEQKTATATEPRKMMNGKPVIEINAKTVLNMESGFGKKLLCDGMVFSLGSACAFDCTYCFVPAVMRKSPHMAGIEQEHHEVVVRRKNAIDLLYKQLTTAKGEPKYKGEQWHRKVCYSSPLVDVAANMELVEETVDAVKLILQLTSWDVRLLSKSNLLPQIAKKLGNYQGAPWRVVYGVSSGILNEEVAKVVEKDTALVSKRIQSIHWLQDNGFRTYAMICPSLPEPSYHDFAQDCAERLRYDRMEHIWAEVINTRGSSFTRTIEALRAAELTGRADMLQMVFDNEDEWEHYARQTFLAHLKFAHHSKFRFMQYSTKKWEGWWYAFEGQGAILL